MNKMENIIKAARPEQIVVYGRYTSVVLTIIGKVSDLSKKELRKASKAERDARTAERRAKRLALQKINKVAEAKASIYKAVELGEEISEQEYNNILAMARKDKNVKNLLTKFFGILKNAYTIMKINLAEVLDYTTQCIAKNMHKIGDFYFDLNKHSLFRA